MLALHLTCGHSQCRCRGIGGKYEQATPTPRRTRERAPPAISRTLESLHDTQAVFLLMRDCGEDCSAAEARRSSDSRDSPLDIVDEGSVCRRGWVYRDEGGREMLPKRYRSCSPVRLCELTGGAGMFISVSDYKGTRAARAWVVPSEIRSGPCLSLTHLGLQGTCDCRLHVRLISLQDHSFPHVSI